MSLVLSLANHADADRIAEIHMAAFGTNAMLLAQFPTPKVREGLQKSIKLKALADIDDARQIVLVVRTLPQNTEDRQLQVDDLPQAVHDKQPDSNGRVIAFAKWTKPIFDGEEDNEPSWIWPEGTNWNMLDKWTKKTDEAHEKAVGRMRCYRTFKSTLFKVFVRLKRSPSAQNWFRCISSTPNRVDFLLLPSSTRLHFILRGKFAY